MAIAYVNSAKKTTSSSPNALTIPSGVAAGHIALIFTSTFAQSQTFSCTTTGVTTPTKLLEVKTGGNGVSTFAFWQMQCVSGDAGKVLTFNVSPTSTYIAVAFSAYSGAALLQTGDYADSSSAANVEPYTSPTVESAVAGCWDIDFVIQGWDGTTTYSEGTMRQQDTDGGTAIYDSNGSIGAAGSTAGGGSWSYSGAAWVTAITAALRPATVTSLGGLLVASGIV